MAHPQTSWIGQTLAGRYQIDAQLGQGGMSVVYKATDPNLRRNVAVKLIHSHLSSDAEFVRRFEQEAAAVAQLRHPNIIQVHDFDHDGDVYFMVLEYVPGETLYARLKAMNEAGHVLPIAETIRIMATVCDAVAYAHRRNMIHRDLKPANVMLNPVGEPILMDFGVAKMLGETHHTAEGDLIGTVSYMAPEQARGERPDERADIYSLGVMLFEMATGRRPFEANTAVTIMMKHLTEPVPDVRQINKAVPSALVNVIEKALAKSPADRYQSAADMATALRGIEQSPPTVSVRAPTTQARQETAVSSRTAVPRRLPLMLGAAAVLGILAIVFLVIAPRGGDGSLPSAEGMIQIDEGVYLVGLDATDSDHAPTQQVKLDRFWIDTYEVTNQQYAAFLSATNAPPPPDWPEGKLPPGHEQLPLQGVTWDQANRYCEWAGKRLPSEAEWEVAARGPEGLLFPWGNDEKTVELPRRGTYPVGSVSGNRSLYGAFDMAGNVWEWVGDTYAPVAEGNRVLRGGTNDFLKDMAFRLQGDPNVPSMIATAGIRCAAPQVAGAAAVPTTVRSVHTELAEGVLYQDDFTDPASGWPDAEQGEYKFGYHPQSFYHLQVSAPNDRLIVAHDEVFDDFIAETNVLVDHTDTGQGDYRYGLALRRTGNAYYAFLISPRTNSWQIAKSSLDGVTVLNQGPIESLRGLQKAPDLLSVEAVGQAFAFRINGQSVAQFTDPDYSSGQVGFIVETVDETLAHIHFADITIRKADAAAALFEDTFVDPNSGWPNIEGDGFFFGYHPPDYYHVEVNKPNAASTVFRGLFFTDFTAEANVLVDHTDSDTGAFRYGLAFRRSGDRYYAAVISPRSQNWQVLKRSGSDTTVLAEGSITSLRGLDKTADRLRVDAGGSTFTFSINDVPVAQVADSEFVDGEIGFVAETVDETLAHVHYDSLTIRNVEPVEIANLPTPTPTATPAPIPIPQGMALIPAGYFLMGSTTGQANETPEHPVLLDAFYMDLFEVSNAQYHECVQAGDCGQSVRRNSFTHAGYRDDKRFDNYPVIGVTWDQAIAYCAWAGKRLPTEAEWEYAASGPDNRTWPWGDAFDANLSAASAPDVQPVDNYPDGASPFGVFNMAGNVTEWVADVYSQSFYADAPASNPLNTGGGDTRIFRGGSFANRRAEFYTTSRRFINDRGYNDVDIGFRCARDASEVNASAPAGERQELATQFCKVYAAYKPDATCP